MPRHAIPTLPSLDALPRLKGVLRDVLGLAPYNALLHLDMAEALACDEHDREEVRRTLGGRLGLDIAAEEVNGCDSIADLLRLLSRLAGPPAWA